VPFVAAILLWAPTSLANAAEATTVNTVLLDMSSVAPRGMMRPGGGPGMMGGGGSGMMGRGGEGGAWGQGMMGPEGPGQGMMGQGLGQGMIGMGMMSIRTDATSASAGPIHFAVTNWSAAFDHEMIVVPVEDPAAPLPYDYGTHTVIEDQIEVLAELELSPGQNGTIDVDLEPGRYLLTCNLPGHYMFGMVTPFIVTQ
jgi:uncharacterized cupredoxin-like copper-binding protein